MPVGPNIADQGATSEEENGRDQWRETVGRKMKKAQATELFFMISAYSSLLDRDHLWFSNFLSVTLLHLYLWQIFSNFLILIKDKMIREIISDRFWSLSIIDRVHAPPMGENSAEGEEERWTRFSTISFYFPSISFYSLLEEQSTDLSCWLSQLVAFYIYFFATVSLIVSDNCKLYVYVWVLKQIFEFICCAYIMLCLSFFLVFLSISFCH